MAAQGNKNKLIVKENQPNQKIGATTFPPLVAVHRSPGNENVIDFNSLVVPASYSALDGFQNPTVSELLSADILRNKGNVLIKSSDRGDLFPREQFYIKRNDQIELLYSTEPDETFTITIFNVVRNLVDFRDEVRSPVTEELSAGQTVIDLGANNEFKANTHPTERVGEFLILVDGDPKFRNSSNSSTTTDGFYYEDGDNGETTSVIVLNSAATGGEKVVAIPYTGKKSAIRNSFKDNLQTLGGQIDNMAAYLSEQFQVSLSEFQASANNSDLRSFGQLVLDIEAQVNSLENLVLEESKFQTKILGSDVTSTGIIAGLTFNNLKPGRAYEINLYGAGSAATSGGSTRVEVFHDGNIKTQWVFDSEDASGTAQHHYSVIAKFTATTTTVTFDVAVNSPGMTLKGDGTLSNTYAQITEYNGGKLTETTDFT